MANGQLAQSIFVRTPSEETLVEDVYKKTGDSTVNSFQDISGTSTDLVDSISFLSKANSSKILIGPTLENAASMRETVDSAMGSATGKAKSLVSDMLGKAKTAFGSVSSATKTITGAMRSGSDAYLQVGNLVKSVKSGNLKDLRSITDTLNSVTGKTSVLLSANGAVGKIYGTVVDQASAAGITDSFKQVADHVKSSSEFVNKGTVLYGMATTSMQGAIGRGDYRNVASMVDSMTTGVVSMFNPSAVKQLAANNTTSVKKTDIGGIAGEFAQQKNAFSKIDPNWNISTWKTKANTAYKDVSALLGASKETKEVFSTGAKMSADADTKWYSIMDAFKEKPTVDSVIKKNYPLSPYVGTPALLKADSDPRVRPAWEAGVILT